MNIYGITVVLLLFVVLPIAAGLHERWLRHNTPSSLEPHELSTTRRLRIVRPIPPAATTVDVEAKHRKISA
jgi:hypothetical protein